jgi:Fic family protein
LRPEDFAENAPGEVVRTPGGFWSFVPNPLPPVIQYPDSLVRQLADAERALGELAGVGRLLPNALLLTRPFLKREAVLSSRIEGTVTRLDQLLLFEAQPEGTVEDSADVREVLNYVHALEYGLNRLQQNMPLCLRLLREIHERLMHGVRGSEKRAGQFRNCPVLIGRHGQSYDEARFVPPHHSTLEPLLRDFEKFLNVREELPIVVQLALAHYQFEAIHPFMNGNGRIGRLLITLMLCERKVLSQPLLYLSAYLERNDAQYRDHLLYISQRGALNEWLAFFAVGVAEQARDAVLRARRLLELQKTYRERMQKASQSSRVLRIVDHLFEAPFVTIPGLARLLKVTHRAATLNVQRLVTKKVLRPLNPRQKTRRVFFAPEILALLNADLTIEPEG